MQIKIWDIARTGRTYYLYNVRHINVEYCCPS